MNTTGPKEDIVASNQKSIYLMQRDVDYIRADIKEIKQGMAEIKTIFVTISNISKDMEFTKDRVTKIESGMSRVNWLILSAVILGVLGVVIKSGVSF